MANPTKVLIASYTVGVGGASYIDFTSIPNTYTDIVGYASLRDSSGNVASDVNIKLNGSDSSKTIIYLQNAGSGFYSFTSVAANGGASTASTFSNCEIYLPNYASSYNKSFSIDRVTENNGTTGYAAILSGVWANTSAINQLTFYGAFVQNSTFYLYGINNS